MPKPTPKPKGCKASKKKDTVESLRAELKALRMAATQLYLAQSRVQAAALATTPFWAILSKSIGLPKGTSTKEIKRHMKNIVRGKKSPFKAAKELLGDTSLTRAAALL